MANKNEKWVHAGAVLRELRRATRLSVHKVGRQIGVSGGYIAKIERGENNPSDAVLESLAELYGKDGQELFNLYNKVESNEIKSFAKLHPEIRKTVTALSTDRDITDEEALQIAERFKEITKEILNGED